MALQDLLLERRDALVADWMARVAACDPEPSARLLRDPLDRARNPVCYAYDRALPVIFDEIAGTMDRTRIASALEPVMHIRTVEELSATDATAFILLLKDTVRDVLRLQPDETGFESWRRFGRRVDEAVLVAFDVFVACRERLEAERAAEARRRRGRAAVVEIAGAAAGQARAGSVR